VDSLVDGGNQFGIVDCKKDGGKFMNSRRFNFRMIPTRLTMAQRYGKEECGTPAEFRFDPYLAAVRFDQSATHQ
jgi:hypothetical protein